MSARWAHFPLYEILHPPHERWCEDKLMNMCGVLRSHHGKPQKRPTGRRQDASCSVHLDPCKSSPWLLKDLLLWGLICLFPLPPDPICYLYIAKFISERVNTVLKRSDTWQHACDGAQGGTDTAAFLEITIWRLFTGKSDTAPGLTEKCRQATIFPFSYHSHFISMLCMKSERLLLSIVFAGFVWKLAIALRHDNTSRVLAELYLSMYFMKEKLKWFWGVEVFSFLPYFSLQQTAQSFYLPDVTLTSQIILTEEICLYATMLWISSLCLNKTWEMCLFGFSLLFFFLI